MDGVEAIAGAAEFLRSLPPDRWAIVTSAPRQLAVKRLEAAGLPTPSVLVTAEDVANGKPAPDCFLLAAGRLGHSASDCVVFEDAVAGIRAAEAAGSAVVVMRGTAPYPESPHRALDNYKDVRVRAGEGGRLTLIATGSAE